MFSYARDLKKYRPLLRVQAFVDTPAATPLLQKRKAAVIRHWFQLILWFVRLRRASKGATPYELLEIETIF
jgi:hypothetical protein